ncbi:Rieske (2Fe-2S) protein [Hydrogenophaga sp. A37]|uniref:Rieske (2Fe-2S) protein n=1 Tax=Hydrogenophaga sp. A37 TaxID=1945864 RepID=UPI000987CD45|nr:Rieske 2Fe-2S domain-containing protein [Hydrogenophaga sp. A37]OOG82786.1 2Fe-2S ferredoxin [Hydrogenophaga sp. A37]
MSRLDGDALQALCNGHELVNGGVAVPFDLMYAGQSCRAFAIRFQGHVHAYLNRCAHVAMEMDWQPNRFFDDSGQWLLCSTHGAVYEPASGACRGGPCRGGLIKVPLVERDGVVFWQAQYPFQPLVF